MMRIAKEKALPFEPLIPNDDTIEAMRAAQRGAFAWSGSADKFSSTAIVPGLKPPCYNTTGAQELND